MGIARIGFNPFNAGMHKRLVIFLKIIDAVFLIFMLIAGLICFLAGEFLATAIINNDVILMALYFGVVGFLLTFFANICAYKISPIREHMPAPSVFVKSLTFFSLVAFISLFIFGGLFQFAYGSDKVEKITTKNYVVAIDNSGSMGDNDPHFQRYEALKKMFGMLSKNQTIGVYTFTDTYTAAFPSQKITNADIDAFDNTFAGSKTSTGGTDFMNVLNGIADDLMLMEDRSCVILISDGASETDDITLRRFSDLGVPIYTVGVCEQDTTYSLHTISAATNGVYYYINNIDGLAEIFGNIYKLNETPKRLLTDYRSGENSVAYTFMRIALIFLLGLMIKLLHFFIIDIAPIRRRLLVQAFVFSLTGAVLTEYLLQSIKTSEYIVHLILCMFISLMLLPVLEKPQSYSTFAESRGRDYLHLAEADNHKNIFD